MENIDICTRAANSSSEFERNNSELKRRYLLHHIFLFNYIAKMTPNNYGTFGTGYPFYALGQNLEGPLPVIEEQLRYNEELFEAVQNSNLTEWKCAECLKENASDMPDLKQVCKPCPNMNPELKPRKILNRLPDIDLWMVCDKNYISATSETLIRLFKEYNMESSDLDPIKTIANIEIINASLRNGEIPNIMLPLDTHIIDYSKFVSLIEQVPDVLKRAINEGRIPYLPIHPLSYRKTWQYDDTAYNFVHDYLSSLTELKLDYDLRKLLAETRSIIADSYSFDQLYDCLIRTGPDSVLRRHRTTPQLKSRFKERIDSWKK